MKTFHFLFLFVSIEIYRFVDRRLLLSFFFLDELESSVRLLEKIRNIYITLQTVQLVIELAIGGLERTDN